MLNYTIKVRFDSNFWILKQPIISHHPSFSPLETGWSSFYQFKLLQYGDPSNWKKRTGSSLGPLCERARAVLCHPATRDLLAGKADWHVEESYLLNTRSTERFRALLSNALGELTLRDLHFWEIEEAFIAHVAFTTTEKHLRAVLLLYAVIPVKDSNRKIINLKLGVFCSWENICSHLNHPGKYTTQVRVKSEETNSNFVIFFEAMKHLWNWNSTGLIFLRQS